MREREEKNIVKYRERKIRKLRGEENRMKKRRAGNMDKIVKGGKR